MNSREKGKRGEREWVDYLRYLGFLDARRGQQYHGGPDSPDVIGGIPNTHAEVKRTNHLNIHKAMRQAELESGEKEIPYVAHRRDREPWLLTLRAIDLVEFAQAICGTPRL